jgi:hypothetical protein
MERRNHAVSLLQASQDSPVLARLADLMRESSARLDAVQSLIPPGLRAAVKAGPIDGPVWCLILDNTAVAAKVRQLLPTLMARLQARGCEVTSIRLKVQIRALP